MSLPDECPAAAPAADSTTALGAGEGPVAQRGRDQRVVAALEALRAGAATGPLQLSGARLIDEDLAGLDLTGADLRGADLSRARLSGTCLMRADLAGAVLFEADLTEAELTAADLRGANLRGARLERAGLGHARLEGACLMNAQLTGATLVEATLVGADLCTADLTGVRARDADWTRADLRRATLFEAELDGGRVRDACFDRADLRHAHLRGLRDFRRASWIGVDIREIDFTGAYLARRFIHDQNFLAEFRGQSRGSRILYWIWWLTSDCGRSTVRWSLCTLVLVTLYAWLYTQVGVDWGDHPTRYSALYYSVVTMTTLGYGDVLPATEGAQWVAMSQVVTGYVMLGGLLSIFSNKMASRAD